MDTAAGETSIAEARLRALAAGDRIDLTLEEAAQVLALTDEWPDAETLLIEVRDTLMLRMSSAVLDVDALAAEIDADLGPTALQQRIEGRHPMTLEEYADVVHAIARNGPH
ncbi:MAG: DUF5791 family protein [Halobacteriaceae archaeon]